MIRLRSPKTLVAKISLPYVGTYRDLGMSYVTWNEYSASTRDWPYVPDIYLQATELSRLR